MAVNLDVYDTLVHAIYDAALHPLRWPQVLERLRLPFDSCSALLFTRSIAQRKADSHLPIASRPQRWNAGVPRASTMTCTPRPRGGGACWSMEWRSTATIWFTRGRRMPPGFTKSCGRLLASRTGAWVSFCWHGCASLAHGDQHLSGPGGGIVHARPCGDAASATGPSVAIVGVMYHLRDSQLQMAASLAALDSLPGALFCWMQRRV